MRERERETRKQQVRDWEGPRDLDKREYGVWGIRGCEYAYSRMPTMLLLRKFYPTLTQKSLLSKLT